MPCFRRCNCNSNQNSGEHSVCGAIAFVSDLEKSVTSCNECRKQEFRQGQAFGLKWSRLHEPSKTLEIMKGPQRQTWQHSCAHVSGRRGPSRSGGCMIMMI